MSQSYDMYVIKKSYSSQGAAVEDISVQCDHPKLNVKYKRKAKLNLPMALSAWQDNDVFCKCKSFKCLHCWRVTAGCWYLNYLNWQINLILWINNINNYMIKPNNSNCQYTRYRLDAMIRITLTYTCIFICIWRNEWLDGSCWLICNMIWISK